MACLYIGATIAPITPGFSSIFFKTQRAPSSDLPLERAARNTTISLSELSALNWDGNKDRIFSVNVFSF
jgi:hypothetical protein